MVVDDRARARGLLAGFASLGCFWGAWAALLPEIKLATGATDGELGLVLGLTALVTLPAMLATGRAVDRWGGRVLPGLVAAFAATSFLPALAHSPVALTLLLFPAAASSGALDVAMNAGVVAFERAASTPLMHRAHATFSLVALTVSLLTGAARSAGAGPVAVLAVVAVALTGAAVVSTPVRSLGGGGTARAATRRPSNRLLLLGGLCALAFLLEGAVASWGAIHLEDTLGASAFVGSLAPALLGGAMVTGRSLGHLRAHLVAGRRLVVLAGVGTAVGAVMLAAAPAVPVALAGIAVFGLALAVAAPTIIGAAGASGPDDREGSSVATATTIAYVGLLVGPFLVGVVADHQGLRTGIGLLAVAGALLAGGAGLLPSDRPRRFGNVAHHDPR